jgi:acetylornithine deacetylase/succinyl-diaminopimelate desuccinylase-like protein
MRWPDSCISPGGDGKFGNCPGVQKMNAVGVLQELIRSPSPFGEEHAAVDIIERELLTLGVETRSVWFAPAKLLKLNGAQRPFSNIPGRRNLVAVREGHGRGRSLILNCHLDTVPPGNPEEWDSGPFSGKIADGRIYGRGAYDDKAGAAICLAVLDRLKSEQIAGDLILHFALEDETTGNGSLLCLDEGPPADAAIIVDGTRGDRGINQHAGNLKFSLTAFGKPASVSVSHMGANAAELLAAACLALKSATLDLNRMNEPPWLQFPSPNQISTIALECGESALTVPDKAKAVLYATFTPPHSVASFSNLAKEVIASVSADYGAKRAPEISIEFSAEPLVSRSSDIEAALCNAAGRTIPFGPSTGTSDMRHFLDRHIPCVLFGPGRGFNPHRSNECFELSSLSEMTDLLSNAVLAWCN